MIQELKRQGLSISAIARQTGLDRKTVKKYLTNGLEAPAYTPRKPVVSAVEPHRQYLLERFRVHRAAAPRRKPTGLRLPLREPPQQRSRLLFIRILDKDDEEIGPADVVDGFPQQSE